jgi:alcohol dehydrogenase class IV
VNIRFEFATATRILFGAGKVAEAGPIARHFGRRALVVTGKSGARARTLVSALGTSDVVSVAYAVAGEPTVAMVLRGVQAAKVERCSFVIGIGGGSAIDAGKAIAALITNPGDILQYLEVIGRAQPLTRPPAPFIAIPTTAGTGAEVTRNAVIASPERRVKVSLRSPLMLPNVALVDPELTHELPPLLTASTGLDALTQLIEPYVSGRANPLTDALCVEGIRRAGRSLWRVFDHGSDKPAREDMALASLFGGLALANAGLGAVHGFAAAIGGMFPAPHGAVCAALLPHVMQANLIAIHERSPNPEALRRYDEIGRLLTGSEEESAAEGISWLGHFVRHAGIPSLRHYGVKEGDFPALIEKAGHSSSMKANPLPLAGEELRQILERAW